MLCTFLSSRWLKFHCLIWCCKSIDILMQWNERKHKQNDNAICMWIFKNTKKNLSGLWKYSIHVFNYNFNLFIFFVLWLVRSVYFVVTKHFSHGQLSNYNLMLTYFCFILCRQTWKFSQKETLCVWVFVYVWQQQQHNTFALRIEVTKTIEKHLQTWKKKCINIKLKNFRASC